MTNFLNERIKLSKKKGNHTNCFFRDFICIFICKYKILNTNHCVLVFIFLAKRFVHFK